MTESPLRNLPVLDQYISLYPENSSIATKDSHLANEPIFIDWSPLLPAGSPWRLGPHFLHILQHHVAMPIKCFDPCQEFPIVTTRDQDLGM